MIYLLYGADTFRSRGKLRGLIDESRARAGAALEMHCFDGAEDDFARLGAIAAGQSLFGGAKKLVVIERLFASARHFAAVRDFLKQGGAGTDALIVVWDSVITGDAQEMLAEITPLADKTQTFDILQGDKLTRWIRKEIAARDFHFSSAEIARLVELGGGDLWAVSNEMEKMGLGSDIFESQGREMATKDMTFLLGDTFFTNPKIALRCLLTLLSRGEEEMRIFSYLAGTARTALVIKSAADAGHSPSYKIHPFVVKKTTAAVRTISASSLVRRLGQFLDADVKIKTGLARPADALMRILTSQLASSPRVL